MPPPVPQYTHTVDRMLTDSQVWALYLGTVLPLVAYHWWLDPNGADAAYADVLAADLGLPTTEPKAEQDAQSKPGLYRFNFGEHMWEALLAVVYGFAYFEQVGEVVQDGPDGRPIWHLRKLASLPQLTLGEILVDRTDGGLKGVRQTNVSITQQGPTMLMGLAPVITVDRLLGYIFLPDGRRRWTGRSMLRSVYREYLVKDRLLRVDAINHERAGGIPGFELDSSYEGSDLNDLRALASAWKVGEESGWVAPPGAKLHLARVGGTDIVGSMRYLDESMSRAWQAMVRQLGHSATGSRALGETFADLESLFRKVVADWFCGIFREHMIEDWWQWNVPPAANGTPAPHPVLRFKPPAPEQAVGIPGGGVAVPETADTTGAPSGGGGSGPPPVAARRPSPRREAAGAAEAAGGDARAPDGGSRYPNGRTRVAAAASLPARPLRRQPYPHEVRAAVDFAALDAVYETTVSDVEGLFASSWLPAQVAAVVASIVFTKSGADRQRVTRADMARVQAPVMDAAALAALLANAARTGAQGAVDELLAQGIPVLGPTEDMLAAAVADHARAVAVQTAEGLSLAASRRAVQLVGERSAREIADEVSAYLHGLEHRWERDQLAGAVQQATNAGRFLVFDRVPTEAAMGFHASELLDASTCDECLAIDGREYETLAAAMRDYPSGGFHRCRGGPRCRGTVVAALPESEQHPGDPAHLGPG
jgi:hypothetical protein